MKKTSVLIFVMAFVLAGVLRAELISEISNPIDGIGAGGIPVLGTNYEYSITVEAADILLMGFSLPVGSANISDISTNVPGWSGNFSGGTTRLITTDFAPIGGFSAVSNPHPGIDEIFWFGVPASPGTYAFGFNSPDAPVDAEWAVTLLMGTTFTTWPMNVGGGDPTDGWGPLHTPVPEPSALALMGLGLAGVVITRRRKNRLS
ncbi:MAG TPA: PEP-CTERM sorting domain-containing protein [Candidatus Brocadiia bacterium]|nr:PEP-CTERM sorting domain-containing protein [Candidatus Brocadiia bacterium]